MKYYKYNPTTFTYSGFIEASIQPENSTKISPLTESTNVWNGVKWVEPTVLILTLVENKSIKIQQVRDYYNEIVQSSINDSAPFEFNTWQTQSSEWTSWINDNTANTPYCDRLALLRGLDRLVLLSRVGERILQFANIQGTLHATEDRIKACTNQSQLDSISW